MTVLYIHFVLYFSLQLSLRIIIAVLRITAIPLHRMDITRPYSNQRRLHLRKNFGRTHVEINMFHACKF
jgi:hypothetical protein